MYDMQKNIIKRGCRKKWSNQSLYKASFKLWIGLVKAQINQADNNVRKNNWVWTIS